MENEENKVYINLKKVPLESERAERRQIRRRRFLIFLLAFFCLLAGLFFGFVMARPFSQSSNRQPGVTANVYSEIQTLIKKRWLYSDNYEDIDTELENKALHGMTDFEEDIFTSYMSKEEMDAFADSINRGYVGDFRQFFRWGYARNVEITMIPYGNPDNDANAGDLAGHNQIYLRGEAYIGWAILQPLAFARIVAAA